MRIPLGTVRVPLLELDRPETFFAVIAGGNLRAVGTPPVKTNAFLFNLFMRRKLVLNWTKHGKGASVLFLVCVYLGQKSVFSSYPTFSLFCPHFEGLLDPILKVGLSI